MNETMGSVIARLRREKGMTQEQLANELGISYQAVSKWENELSSPDISALPLLADIFGVSVDALFGREAEKREEKEAAAAQQEPQGRSEGVELPWPDDEDTLHVVLFAGHKLVGHSGGEHLFSKKQVSFQYEGPALNIESDFAVTVDGNVDGSVTAGGDVNCDTVGGDVHAGGGVTCDTVEGNVDGSVTAGGDVQCGMVGGDVHAEGDITCEAVGGNVEADGDVCCGAVGGDVRAEGDVRCGVVGGTVQASGDVNCDEMNGASDGGEHGKKGKGFSFRIKL